jgi:Rad3-related DNA helicase
MDATRQVVLTATNALLDQYDRVYPHLMPIRGAGNYECLAATGELATYFPTATRGEISCEDGPCKAGLHCSLKEGGCLYFDQLRAALRSTSPLTNYAYWLAMRRFAGGLGDVGRVIVDEAHALPDELMKAHAISISSRQRGGTAYRTVQQWAEWGGGQAARLRVEIDHLGNGRPRERLRLQRQLSSFESLARMDAASWAFDFDSHGGVQFEPTVPRLLLPLLANRSERMLYLSATVTPAMLTDLFGVDPSEVESVVLPSTFPVERRPIYLLKTARIDKRADRVSLGYWVEQIDRLISDRLDRKGIIHTVSYDRQQFLLTSSAHRSIMLAPRGSVGLAAAVTEFKRARGPLVLVSPSIEQGFDFPYDECEYVIVGKVPFPDTRSAIMRARIAATPGYRDHATMQRLVQMCGRGMRHDDDSCEVFIVDDHARWFVGKLGHQLAPQWWMDAVQFVRFHPEPLPKLAAA